MSLYHPVRALYWDILGALEITEETANRHIHVLEHHEVGYFEDNDGVPEIVVAGPDWEMWSDIKKYARLKSFPISELIVEGRLELLD